MSDSPENNQQAGPTWRKWAESHVETLRADRLEAIEQRRALVAGEVRTYRGSVDTSAQTVQLYERSIAALDEAISGYEADLADGVFEA